MKVVAPVSFDRLAFVLVLSCPMRACCKVPVSGDRLTLITQVAPVSFDRLAIEVLQFDVLQDKLHE